MELKQIRCTTCGESLSIETALNEVTCQACGNTFLMTQGIHLNNKTDDEIDTLKNLRIQLKRSVERQDIQSIEYHALEILKIIPDDYVSQYFFSYASYNLNKPKAFYEFLELDIASTQEDKRYVVEHMKAYADIKEYEKLHQYVDRVYPEMSEALTQTLNQRIQQEDHYSVIDRDVFICHRSTDNKKALEVLNALEADGHTCWISSRNLRPDDSINYWSNIEEAIENCRVFLVISSQSAMLSKDVQKELQLANKMNKAKIEYKIDDSVHTTLFKRSFDGVKWIEAIKGNNIETLQERVLDALEEVETKQKPKQTETKASLENTKGDDQSAKLKSLLVKLETQIRLEEFEEAEETIEKIHEIDYQNEYAWWSKLLCEYKFTNFNDMFLELTSDKILMVNILKDGIFSKINKLYKNSKNMNTFDKLASKFKNQAIKDKDLDFYKLLSGYFPNEKDKYHIVLLEEDIGELIELKDLIKKNPLYWTSTRFNNLKFRLKNANEDKNLSENDLELFEDFHKLIEKNEQGEKERQIKQKEEKEKQQIEQKLKKRHQEKIMKKSKLILKISAILIFVVGFSYFIINDKFNGKITASDGSSSYFFGITVALDGTTLVVGASGDDDKGTDSGSVYVYDLTKNIGDAGFERKITASDGSSSDFFGITVALDGTTLVVGAYGDNDKGTDSGSVYVYDLTKNSGDAGFERKITASDGAPADYFGQSVAIDGNTLVVGAYYDDDNGSGSGSVYVYDLTKNSGDARFERKITASDGVANDFFGISVAIDGTTLVVDAAGDDDNGSSSGSVYVYDLTKNSFESGFERKITASDAQTFDFFGSSVALDGTTLVVGASGDDDKKMDSGSVYVYDLTKNIGDAGFERKITAADGSASDHFSISVALDGTTLVVGAYKDNDKGTDSGSVYVYDLTKNSGDEGFERKITAFDGALDDYFGRSVAIDGTTIVVGAYLEDDNGSDSGSVYIYNNKIGSGVFFIVGFMIFFTGCISAYFVYTKRK